MFEIFDACTGQTIGWSRTAENAVLRIDTRRWDTELVGDYVYVDLHYAARSWPSGW